MARLGEPDFSIHCPKRRLGVRPTKEVRTEFLLRTSAGRTWSTCIATQDSHDLAARQATILGCSVHWPGAYPKYYTRTEDRSMSMSLDVPFNPCARKAAHGRVTWSHFLQMLHGTPQPTDTLSRIVPYSPTAADICKGC